MCLAVSTQIEKSSFDT